MTKHVDVSEQMKKKLREVLESQILTYHRSVQDRSDELETEISEELLRYSKGMEFYLNCRVAKSRLVLRPGRVPAVAISLKYGKKSVTTDSNPLLDVVVAFTHRGSYKVRTHEVLKAISPMLDPVREAMFQADIANARVKAMADRSRHAVIQGRIDAARAADRERYMAEVRSLFSRHDNLVTEDDVLQIWRETFVAKVMES